jgi:lipoprotein-anchoring transpeptidase ErfK/SrfK
MISRLRLGIAAAIVACTLPGLAAATIATTQSMEAARVVATVHLSSQTMVVQKDGQKIAEWPVSTARRGKITPTGAYTPEYLSRYYKSSRYNNAPMPYSIFFHGHYAVHGTDQISRLGRPASAGCVRLHPENAAKLFEMTKAVGLEHVQIVIVD